MPIRTASLVPRTDETATHVATGNKRTPVDRGPYPLRNWKYWVTRKMNPDRAKNEIPDRGAGGGEPRVTEQAQVEHRLLGPPLPCHERRRHSRGRHEAGDRARALPQPWAGASMIV